MAVAAERLKVRENFVTAYGDCCQNIDRHCFGPDSDFLPQLLFFFNPKNAADLSILRVTCRFFLKFAHESGNVLSLFAGVDYSSKHAIVDYRVKKLAYDCVQAVYENRNQLMDPLHMASDKSSSSTFLPLEAVFILIDFSLPWTCKVVGYLVQTKIYVLLREILLTGKKILKLQNSSQDRSSLEQVLAHIISHVGKKWCTCSNVDPRFSFSSQILTIPFLWKHFPNLKEVLSSRDVSQHYIHHIALCIQNHTSVLPNDISPEFPGYACLLGNILETVGSTFSHSDSSLDMAIDFAAVATYLLEALPRLQSSSETNRENSTIDEEEMIVEDEANEKALNKDLEQQIINAIDPRFLLQLTNILFGGISLASDSYKGIDSKENVAIGAACAFLHATFNILPLERSMTVLAYRTELVPVLWNYMKRWHENQKWPPITGLSAYLPGDSPGWLLPLAVFCPVYKHMLMIVDNEEFYEQEKPLSLKDIKSLVVILRQALWQLLWVNPIALPNLAKSTSDVFSLKKHPIEFLQHRVSIAASELLSQLQDWNNRKQFTSPSDFHADGVNEHFMSQAMIENNRAYEILRHAPFLVPFTSRAKIFASQLAAARHRHGSLFTRHRLRIRRDHILEDSFNQLNSISEEDLRGPIRVSFVNEFGVEEAGIDGGGIFKDFMENITRAAFDVQYGLFKETTDHLLFPNPGSGLIHEQHLQFFHFLGTVLGKAMFEGILVDIPFATFFLSKLKQKFNYLNDLPSLDPELYRHLIFLKHFEGDVSELELYFVVVNNEYGEQSEEELLPGGKNMRVTNDNVITFIHLVSNHRLNFQIRQQSSHFLRGFQQLIQKDWIDMFNEHELQLLISGTVDGFDIDDLRSNTNYTGGYHHDHYVIEMFWEILKHFSRENQMKFLKFVTGCSRGPLLGFKFLEPLFCIQRTGGDNSDEFLDRLPTSATCMNLLKLPPYRSKEQMEQKLLYAINAEAGFDLS